VAATDEIIYHYTRPKGLIGILSDGQFWATDIKYLNDGLEELHGEAMIEKFLDAISRNSDDNKKTIADDCLEILRRTPHWLNEKIATYVVCFSSDGDSKEMWNAYGSAGSGFSVGIQRRALEQEIGERPAFKKWPAGGTKLVKVRYTEEDQMHFLREGFDDICSHPADSLNGYAGIVAIIASRAASSLKHPCFKGECEWRVVTSPNLSGSSGVFFRPSARTVVPYVKVPSIKRNGWKLPIASITIGPTLHQELSVRSAMTLLVANGYSLEDVEIRRSELPLVLTG
jgi:hypothetical protein